MKKGKGDSGKLYHVLKEEKQRKKSQKELNKMIEDIFDGRFRERRINE